MRDIRVRFAPSPTGPLHIGGLRTALFNYLFARKWGGKFLLRIEDTDQLRFVPGAEEYILEALEWCGIVPDEGPGKGGEYGPYRQSERRNIYREYALQLINTGHAYYAFDTADELEEARRGAEGKKETFTYDSSTRGRMRNSLSLPGQQVIKLLEQGIPYVIRFRFDPGLQVKMVDRIRGHVQVDSGTLDDKIIFKSDGMPTYHLANVVDDYLMKISHVIRGEEWLPSLPLHVSLYRAFKWEDRMPEFAHLPLILKPDGKGKLSKRDGDRGGFPVFPLDWKDSSSGEISRGYREAGYFPEACVNIIAFLGWNPGTEKELYTLEELIGDFDLGKVGKAGAKFDPEKARWYNHQYMQLKPVEELSRLIRIELHEKGIQPGTIELGAIVELMRERADFIGDMCEQSVFFFKAPENFDEYALKKQWKEDTPLLMQALLEILERIEPFQADHIENIVKADAEAMGWGLGRIMNPLRILLVGALQGPSLFKTAEILGKEEVIRRIRDGLSRIQ